MYLFTFVLTENLLQDAAGFRVFDFPSKGGEGGGHPSATSRCGNLLLLSLSADEPALLMTSLQLKAVKATLWAIGHIGSCQAGFAMLPADTCSRVAGLAASGPNMLLRGTCIYVLGLLGATQTGAQTLNELGWDVRQTAHTGVGEQICVAVPSDTSQVFYMSQRKLARKTSQEGARRRSSMFRSPSSSSKVGMSAENPAPAATKIWRVVEGESVNSTIEAVVEPLLAAADSALSSSGTSSNTSGANSGRSSGPASRGEPSGAGTGATSRRSSLHAATATAAAAQEVALAAAVLRDSTGSNSPGGSRRAARPPRPSHPDSPAARKKAKRAAEVLDAALQCVACMSNEIVLTKARSLLGQLRLRHKAIFESSRFYLKVRELIDSALFGLDTRRMLHNLFRDVSFLAKEWSYTPASQPATVSASTSTPSDSRPSSLYDPALITVSLAESPPPPASAADVLNAAAAKLVAAETETDRPPDSGGGNAAAVGGGGGGGGGAAAATVLVLDVQPPPLWAVFGESAAKYTEELAADEEEAWRRVRAAQQLRP